MTNKYSDQQLFELCKRFGSQALEARRKFLGLLPEVNKRRLYEKKGFQSIFEFAKKLAGASEEQVRIVLNLERRFEDKPALQIMLVNGEVSVNKLARVVSIATPENQEELAVQVRILPKSALETLTRDIKHSTTNGFGEPSSGLPGQTMLTTCNEEEKTQTHENHGIASDEKVVSPGELLSMKVNLKLGNDIVSELHELQEKGININEILREALNNRRSEIAQEKEKLANEEMEKCQLWVMEADKHSVSTRRSRYISVRIKRVLADEHGTKCSIQNCQNKLEEIHHTQRFALMQSYDPHFLAPLCREHHLIAHSVDEMFWRKRR